MDVSFSAKPQILTLFSYNHFASTSSSLSPSKLRSIRSEFLGCGHNLRPPGGLLRYRRRNGKLGPYFYSTRFRFRASLTSHSVLVVVAVVTFSAVSIFYWNRFRSKKNAKMAWGPPNFALPELGRNFKNQDMESQILGLGDFHDVKVHKMLENEIREKSHASEDKEAQLQYQKSAWVHEEALIANSVQSPGSNNVVASSVGDIDIAFSNNSEVMDKSLSTAFSISATLQSLHLPHELTGLQLEELQEKIESDSGFDGEMGESKLSNGSIHVNNSLAGLHEHKNEKNELDEEGKTATYVNVLLGEPAREELYMFYEANRSKSMTKNLENLNGKRTLSSHASLLDGSTFSSSLKNNILDGADVSAQVSPKISEYVEGKIPSASYKSGHPCSRKDSGKGNGHSRNNEETRHFTQNNHKILPLLPDLNELNVDDRHHTSEQLSAYNRLLKDGRLTDSVELLEDMERRGLLDMNKVYHAKFFKICKSQKAINEAFRYFKLITNPTLSTFNMLMSVCASSQYSEGAFQVLRLAQDAGLKADCKLYTTLISTCAKSGKVDAMFKVFHEMVNAGVEPNVHTYGALIDGCARAGQVAKAFGAYGIMRSKNVKPDRVVFNALITACGQSGAVDRAFDVLSEMTTETQPIDPDHITIGALIKACMNAGQVDRAQEVYKMIHKYKIKGTPEVYTIAVNCCSQTGDWEFARNVYDDMTKKGVIPDEMFLSALIDVAGHAGNLDDAFEILQEVSNQGVHAGIMSYSSLMGACCNAKNWQKALELYGNLKSMKLELTVSTVNALITALCDGDQLEKAIEVLSEMKAIGLCPDSITYSVLVVACDRKDDLEAGLMLLSQAKKDGIPLNLTMCRCIIGMCLRRFEKACTVGEPVFSFNSGQLQVENKWTSSALMVYRETIVAGVMPTIEVLSQVLGCLRLPYDASLKNRLIENMGVSADTSRPSKLYSLIDGFCEYDPRAFSLLEEAASIGIVQCVSFKESPVVVDARKLETHTAEVYLLTVLRALKHRLAAGSKLPNITILVPVEKTQIISPKGEKTINLAGRVGQAVAALLRRLRLPYQGNESHGKIRINGLAMKRWFQPKLASPFSGKPEELSSPQFRLGRGISHQQRNIRTANLSLD
ncbi:pentatricopeptide repeat-containing protein MRL1, chloroplastic [Ziziphus jujuba]|uniref:Pentatricopeptide repeat-containing protein MRL1, chloroplastic n=2 Tax=Ziziphus jujuba TaxID=326968 RepID=A0A6P4B4J0_ZIZJJ|nr:pentatricopeptide repeat-containing protein MRL1, chloroplastic [Ziziphus jujuba]KAH7518493.1 hypothetical protein FEM48_Zijuj09G0177200 [Ziziphus jujuba var. spinosa]